MDYIADLHIHSPYSRATSKLSHLHGLAAWASIKGINVVGTGDFTHPGWLAHLNENLEEAEPGFFRLKDTNPQLYRDAVPEELEPDISNIRFVLTSEISSIYKRDDRVRKIHNILFAPDLETVKRINVSLSAIGNLESDGRPILGLDSRNLLEILLENGPEGFLVPAHIWTPWFSLFGSKSGFDTIEECFADLTDHVFALETGLSSDPDMNRTISALDNYTLISNSDCHSPSKLGREANLFSTGFDYFSLREALKHPVDKNGVQQFTGTVEFYPEEGKYHCDGHRKCKVCMEPKETRANDGICPACGKPVTVGVLYRVMELADRTAPVYPEGSPVVHSLVPLPELLGELLQVGPATKKVMQAYVRLIQRFGSEFSLLLQSDINDIEQFSSPHLAEAIHRVRTGKVIRQPGYDGEFGVIRVFSESERKAFGGQKSLFATVDAVVPQKIKRKVKRIGSTGVKAKKKQTDIKKKLNPEQQKIVDSDAKHILVKAGPGTGKTHTLVQRVIRIAGQQINTPCTVITFTNKAAKELTERIEASLGEDNSIHISTLHSYCLHWLRQKNPEIKVAGQDLRKRLLGTIRKPGDAVTVEQLDREITLFLQQAPDMLAQVPEIFTAYFTALDSANMVDIDGVIPSFTALLKKQDSYSETIRKATGNIFIDEFQDLNQSQYAMIKLLAQTSAVFAIGDPDQAIYGFRGSDPAWFFRFAEELHPQHFSLIRNYRSGEKIVAAANKVITHNRLSGDPNLSEAKNQGRIYYHAANSPVKEAQFIVKQIEMLVGGSSHREIERFHQQAELEEISLGNIAVLYRTTRQAEIHASVLQEHGFPVQVVDIVPFYLQGTMRYLYWWVLLITGRADIGHLLSLFQHHGMSKKDLQVLENSDAMGFRAVQDFLNAEKENFSSEIKRKIDTIQLLGEKVFSITEEKDVESALKFLAEQENISIEDPGLIRLLRLAANFSSDLDGFASHLLRYNDSVVYDERAEAVTLSTLHASKGLEFRVVFIVGLEEGILPISCKTDDPTVIEKHIEEERRLFYVGMTRAEEILYLSSAGKRVVAGKDVEQQPSRFLKEIPGNLYSKVQKNSKRKTPVKRAQQLRLFG